MRLHPYSYRSSGTEAYAIAPFALGGVASIALAGPAGRHGADASPACTPQAYGDARPSARAWALAEYGRGDAKPDGAFCAQHGVGR